MYFFDLIDGDRRYSDSEGVSLDDDESAFREARGILGDMLRHGTATPFDLTVDGHLRIVVRTKEIPNVVTLKMTISVEVEPAAIAH
jgi:hypothetical protein